MPGSSPTTDHPGQHQPWRHLLHERHRDNDLARGALGTVEVLGQSIDGGRARGSPGSRAPCPSPGTPPEPARSASVVVGTAIVLLVAVVVAQFARERASTGSLYSYAAEGLGPWAGFAGGWGLALGYAGIASACAAGVALFTGAFLDEIGVPAGGTVVQLGLLVAAIVLAVYVTVQGIRNCPPSSRSCWRSALWPRSWPSSSQPWCTSGCTWTRSRPLPWPPRRRTTSFSGR